LPNEAKEKVKKEINRLENIPAMSPEHSYIRTYIEWMLDIPWTEKTKDILDIIKRIRSIRVPSHLRLLPASEIRINIVLHAPDFFMETDYLMGDVTHAIVHMWKRNQFAYLVLQREYFPFKLQNLNHIKNLSQKKRYFSNFQEHPITKIRIFCQ